MNAQAFDGVQPLNALERAGWAALAREILGVRPGEAVALRELVMNAGRVVSYETLDACFGPHFDREGSAAARRLGCYIARLRAPLEDIGVPRSAIENMPGVGYAISTHQARRIRALVEGCA